MLPHSRKLLARPLAAAAFALAFAFACKNGAANVPPSAQAAEPAKTPPPATLASAGSGGRTLTPERAHELLPRADLADLTPEQLQSLYEVAGDTPDYAGCNSTLAACLKADVKDKHAPRMARAAAMLLKSGFSASQVVDMLERYYTSFLKKNRAALRTDDCGSFGPAKAPVVVVEFSDFQCPHCAVAAKWLPGVIEGAGGNARLCSKYFPLTQHPRAAIAAACAEYARGKGKFFELGDQMFEHQEQLSDDDLKTYAAKAGLNGAEMLKQAYAGKFQPIIDAHLAEATAGALRATPTFFLNGRMLQLPATAEFLLFSIEDELEWIRGGQGWEKE